MFIYDLANDITDGSSISPTKWDDIGLRQYEIEIYEMSINRVVSMYILMLNVFIDQSAMRDGQFVFHSDDCNICDKVR